MELDIQKINYNERKHRDRFEIIREFAFMVGSNYYVANVDRDYIPSEDELKEFTKTSKQFPVIVNRSKEKDGYLIYERYDFYTFLNKTTHYTTVPIKYVLTIDFKNHNKVSSLLISMDDYLELYKNIFFEDILLNYGKYIYKTLSSLKFVKLEKISYDEFQMFKDNWLKKRDNYIKSVVEREKHKDKYIEIFEKVILKPLEERLGRKIEYNIDCVDKHRYDFSFKSGDLYVSIENFCIFNFFIHGRFYELGMFKEYKIISQYITELIENKEYTVSEENYYNEYRNEVYNNGYILIDSNKFGVEFSQEELKDRK